MKSGLLSDAQTAVGLFKAMRKARKAGQAVKVEGTISVPLIQSGAGIYDTVEGCVLSHCNREIVEASRKAFNSLSPEEKHQLAFAPENGEFIERALFWKELLAPVMASKNCHMAMVEILDWYIHIKEMNSPNVKCASPAAGQKVAGIQNKFEIKTPVHVYRSST